MSSPIPSSKQERTASGGVLLRNVAGHLDRRAEIGDFGAEVPQQNAGSHEDASRRPRVRALTMQ